jgi:hypothetical protein
VSRRLEDDSMGDAAGSAMARAEMVLKRVDKMVRDLILISERIRTGPKECWMVTETCLK